MIAVLIPARNEEAVLATCLGAVARASLAPGLAGEDVLAVVALDRCTDGTADIAHAFGAHVIESTAGTVGDARAAAANYAIERGARWLAMTDADSVVPPNWLEAQLSYGCDAFCGVVQVDDWQDYHTGMPTAFIGCEQVREGHMHVHGANMGLSTATYLAVGGFRSLQVSEDVELIGRVAAYGHSIARKPTPIVSTSARRTARAAGGFADYLAALESTLLVRYDGSRCDRD